MRKYLERHLEQMREEADEGFTLIELLVVLLIIGILLAIAIPTFLSVTKSANNTAAQSNLQTAVTAADAYYTANNQDYTNIDNSAATVSTITQQNTGLIFSTTATSTDSKHISLASGSEYVVLETLSSGNNRCYVIYDLKSSTGGISGYPTTVGTWYGYYAKPAGGCVAAGASAVPASSPTTPGAWNQSTWK